MSQTNLEEILEWWLDNGNTHKLEHDKHLAQAEQQIKEWVSREIIGADDKEVRGTTHNPDNPKHWTRKTAHRNELRADQRKQLGLPAQKENK